MQPEEEPVQMRYHSSSSDRPTAPSNRPFPTGLEGLELPHPPGKAPQRSEPAARALFYRCEQIFIAALEAALATHFEARYPGIAPTRFALRPEPKNLSYYYCYDENERLVVLHHGSLKRWLVERFEQLLRRARVGGSFEQLRVETTTALEEVLVGENLQVRELTLGEEKAYLRRVFQQRYGVGSKKGARGPPPSIEAKMRELSHAKYTAALRLALETVDPTPLDAPAEDHGGLAHRLRDRGLNPILDLGAGTMGPEFFQRLADEGLSYTGVDLVPVGIARGKPKLRFARGDIEHLPRKVRDRDYVLALAINALETTTRPWLALEQCATTLAHKALLLAEFNQYEGSFLYTGNPFTLERFLTAAEERFVPRGGALIVTPDSPTGRDWVVVLERTGCDTRAQDSSSEPPQLKISSGGARSGRSRRRAPGTVLATLQFS